MPFNTKTKNLSLFLHRFFGYLNSLDSLLHNIKHIAPKIDGIRLWIVNDVDHAMNSMRFHIRAMSVNTSHGEMIQVSLMVSKNVKKN